MLRLFWRESALDDLDRIVLYIGQHNFDAGARMQDMIKACAERLTEHPFMFRSGRTPGTREALVHPNYVVVYRVGADTVEIVNILHTRREYPPSDPE